MIFDSYYFSAETRQIILQNNIKVCAAITPTKYRDPVKMVDRWILQPGDIAAVYNDPHREFILGYFNPDPMVSLLVVFSLIIISHSIYIYIGWKEIHLEQHNHLQRL